MATTSTRTALMQVLGILALIGLFMNLPLGNARREPPNSAAGPVLVLTPQDITDLKRVVTTEVVHTLKDESFVPQVRAVTDTILNRWASKHWGSSLRAVVNAPWQFSMINSNLPGAWGAVEKIPVSAISRRVSVEVDRWLVLRAAGAASIVGDHLHYLNVHYSSQRSLRAWGYEVASLAEKAGLVFGSGKAKHWHFTDPKMNAARPGPVRIILQDTKFVASDRRCPSHVRG